MGPGLLQFSEFLPHHITVFIDLDTDELHSALCEFSKVSRTWVFNQSHNRFSCFQLGIDAEIDIEMLLIKNPSFARIFEITDPSDPLGDLRLCSRNETGDHVDLVAVRDGDHHFRLFHPCLVQNRWAAALAENCFHIEAFIDLPYLFRIVIDDHHIMAFLRELLGQIVSDLASTNDDNVHSFFPHTSKDVCYREVIKTE